MSNYIIYLGKNEIEQEVVLDVTQHVSTVLVGGQRKPAIVEKILSGLNEQNDEKEIGFILLSGEEDNVLKAFSQSSDKVRSYTYGHVDELLEAVRDLQREEAQRNEVAPEPEILFVLVRKLSGLQGAPDEREEVNEVISQIVENRDNNGIRFLFVEDKLEKDEASKTIRENSTAKIATGPVKDLVQELLTTDIDDLGDETVAYVELNGQLEVVTLGEKE